MFHYQNLCTYLTSSLMSRGTLIGKIFDLFTFVKLKTPINQPSIIPGHAMSCQLRHQWSHSNPRSPDLSISTCASLITLRGYTYKTPNTPPSSIIIIHGRRWPFVKHHSRNWHSTNTKPRHLHIWRHFFLFTRTALGDIKFIARKARDCILFGT